LELVGRVEKYYAPGSLKNDLCGLRTLRQPRQIALLRAFHERKLIAAGCLKRVAWLLPALAFSTLAQGIFTIHVGPPDNGVALVAHSDVWRFHRGTNAPPAGWQTNADASLDSSWSSGAGGLGYADNAPELGLVQTVLNDMQNLYSTLYLRRSFAITNTVDAALLLELTMDWDDGFVAWLDGQELAPRMNAPGGAGTEPASTAVATASHESFRGNNSPQPAMTFSLGPVAGRLQPGTHILAILGLNQATNSSDFVMIPDLSLRDGQSTVVNGTLFSIVKTNTVTLSGTNTISGSAKVLVDGVDAAFDAGTGAWSRTVALSPGFNRIWLQVMDLDGVQLLATNQDVVAELSSVRVGGTLTGNRVFDSSMGVIHVTNSLVVAPGGTLSVGPGCVLLFAPGASLLLTNATLIAEGTEAAPICIAPDDGSTVWGGLIVSGAAGHISAKHVETIAGHLEVFDAAEALFEDSYFHDYTVSSPAIIHTLGQPAHCTVTLRRCHVNRYYEVLCQLSTNTFDNCLLENMVAGGDGIDFDGGQPGSVIRRCTVRHGRFTNIDALDMGEIGAEGSRGVLIDSCLLYDFVDKGISMGVQVDVTVTNCLLHHLDTGVAVKDLSTAGIFNCTIVSNSYGFRCYNKPNPASPTGGGFITNSFNNILWGNTQTFSLLNGSTLGATYSDFQGTNFPGAGNVDTDPLWANPPGLDFRLGPSSPLIGAGRGGANLGASFPVGADMASSHPVIHSANRSGDRMVVEFWADSDKNYSLVASQSLGGPWIKVKDVFLGPLPRKVVFDEQVTVTGARFYRLVTPRLP
jgi:hypothetical protein